MTRAERKVMWQRHVDAWRASGLSLSAYCAGRRLSRESMRRWRRRLALAPIGDGKAMSSGRGIGGALVPIQVCEARSAKPIATGGLVEIRLQRGGSIVIDAEADEARLARLIAIVERAP